MLGIKASSIAYEGEGRDEVTLARFFAYGRLLQSLQSTLIGENDVRLMLNRAIQTPIRASRLYLSNIKVTLNIGYIRHRDLNPYKYHKLNLTARELITRDLLWHFKNLKCALTQSQFPVFTIYAQKSCLAVKPCERAWCIDRVQGHRLQGHTKRTTSASSRQHCLELCLGERDFLCRCGSPTSTTDAAGASGCKSDTGGGGRVRTRVTLLEKRLQAHHCGKSSGWLVPGTWYGKFLPRIQIVLLPENNEAKES
ncbi:hypothetical protein KQX54_016127 [Cotesia glomerata]|uniref:Uncharacterized protein n=1 Tax=Cotesia glomerata TaxID=32391 RepID=A0AAV7INM0_COTGL|nr:hypothetical protein KQX54_016127 [Cotesia glomerata]